MDGTTFSTEPIYGRSNTQVLAGTAGNSSHSRNHPALKVSQELLRPKIKYFLFPLTRPIQFETGPDPKNIQIFCSYHKPGNFCVVQFSRNFAVSIKPRKLKPAKYFPIFENLMLRNWWVIWLQFAVVTYSPAVRPVICNYLKTVCHYKPFD